jgi:hypothetical protein
LRVKPTHGRVSGFAPAVGVLFLVSGLLCAGCVGYLTGSYDAEVQRLRAIVAELEAKNAALAVECIELRGRVRELEGEVDAAPVGEADGGAGAAAVETGSPDM